MPPPAGTAALRDQLLDLYRQTAAEIDARLLELATADVRATVLRRRLTEMSASIRHEMAVLDAATRGWIQDELPLIYAAGARSAAEAAGARFAWSQIHVAAVQELASDMHADLLRATRYVTADTKRFVSEAARNATRRSIVGGYTARQAGRDLASTLREAFGTDPIAAVRYANGARHSLADYADTVVRSKTAEALNLGTLNTSRESGVTFMECFDGPACGLSSHNDGQKANGLVLPIDVAFQYPSAHPRCARAWGARPDVRTAKQAQAAVKEVSPAERARLAAAEQARAAAQPPTLSRAAQARRQQIADRRAARVAAHGVPQPRPLVAASGTSPRSAIASMPGPRSAVGRGVIHALDQIEAVHRIPGGLPAIPVKPSTAKTRYGAYAYTGTGKAVNITIKTAGDHISGTFAHEFGHYLDHQADLVGQVQSQVARMAERGFSHPPRPVFGSGTVGRTDPLMAAFDAAVDATPTKRALEEMAKGNATAAYYNSRVETWARAYHQWIATRSGSSSMIEEIAAIRNKGEVSRLSQWGDEEFGPLADALDAIFRAKGLLVE